MGKTWRSNLLFVTTLFAITEFVSSAVLNKNWESESVVLIPQGFLRGNREISRSGKEYVSFKGITYATAERFQAPQKPKRWTGLINATEEGEKCLRFNNKKVEGSEKCLFANIYTPKLPSSAEEDETSREKLPVMVYIHDDSGSEGEYKPDYLLDEEVVLVTFNYRTGPLGFLSTGDSKIKGNFGLKDQVMLLKWVSKNIEYFNGNPQRVTLFGGSHVSYHLLSAQSSYLFHNAIVQSGNALCSLQKDPKLTSKDLARQLDCPNDSSNEIEECLRGKDSIEIVSAVQKLSKMSHVDPNSLFTPVIETSEDAFISKHPKTMLISGPVNKLPLIIGITKNEGAEKSEKLWNSPIKNQLEKDWNKYAPEVFGYKASNVKSENLKKFYFGAGGALTRKGLSSLFTDKDYATCTRDFAFLHGRYSPTFLYLFAYNGESSQLNTLGFDNKETKFITHGDDLQYLFKMKDQTLNSDDDQMSKRYVKLLSSFAIHGYPTGTWEPENKWSSLEIENKLKWYELNKETKLNESPFEGRLDFWQDFIDTEEDSDSISKDNIVHFKRDTSSSEVKRDTSSTVKTTTTKKPTTTTRSSYARRASTTTARPSLISTFTNLFRSGGSSSGGQQSLLSRLWAKLMQAFQFVTRTIRTLWTSLSSRFGNSSSSSLSSSSSSPSLFLS